MPEGEPRSWHHTGLIVSDLRRAVSFYRDCLGYEEDFVATDITEEAASILGLSRARADVAQMRLPGSSHVLELVQLRESVGPPGDHGPAAPGEAHVAYRVVDLDGAIAGAIALGAAKIGEVTMFPDGRAVYLRTPVGTVIELEEEPPGG